MNAKDFFAKYQMAIASSLAALIFIAGCLLVLSLDQNTRYPAVRNAARWLAVNEIANSLFNYYQLHQQLPADLSEQWRLIGTAADCTVACQGVMTAKTCLKPQSFTTIEEADGWLQQKYSRFSDQLSGYAVSYQTGQIKVRSCFTDLGEKIETYRLLNNH